MSAVRELSVTASSLRVDDVILLDTPEGARAAIWQRVVSIDSTRLDPDFRTDDPAVRILRLADLDGNPESPYYSYPYVYQRDTLVVLRLPCP